MNDDVATTLSRCQERLDYIENQVSKAKLFIALGAILVLGVILLNREHHGKN